MGLIFNSYEIVNDPVPPKGMFDTVCKTCWPEGSDLTGVIEVDNEDSTDTSDTDSS